jgi:nicotinamide-nucleotide amidase
LLSPVADEIYNRLNPRIYGENEVSLAEVVLDMLKKQNHTLAVAESCTGGLVASDLVSVPGCSDVFREGFIAYANEAKFARLFVPESLLAAHGAVSAEVAAAMAQGAATAATATVAVSTTGIAGPDGGTSNKPVGLVYVGLFIEGRGTFTEKFNLIGSRNEVRRRAAISALDFLRLTILHVTRYYVFATTNRRFLLP